MVRSSCLSSTRRRGSISFVSTTNPIAFWEQQETRVQRREAVSARPMQADIRSSVLSLGREALYQQLATFNLRLYLLARPPGIAVRLPQLVFEGIQPLPQVGNFLLLGVDFRRLVVDVSPGVLLGHGFLWVRIVLQLRFFQFALQNVEFLLGLRNLIVLLLKPLSPGRFAVLVLFGGLSCRRCCRCRRRTVSAAGGRATRGRASCRGRLRRGLLKVVIGINFLGL